MEKYYVKHNEIQQSAQNIAQDIIAKHSKEFPPVLYGIPRGGIPAMYAVCNYLQGCLVTDNPEEATVFIDDIVDSGRTRDRYMQQYPNSMFYALHEKKDKNGNTDNRWLVFPWEDSQGCITDNVTRLLQYIGEDPTREGLTRTPERVINAYNEWFSGYKQDPDTMFVSFEDGKDGYDQMVTLRNIPFYSHCEHHMAPFFGTVTIGYIPNKRIIGLSKLARLVEIYSRRLQVQERMTQQIANIIMDKLSPLGVGVIVKARHFCMESRGANIFGAETVTTSMLGAFRNESVKNELFTITNK